MLQAQSTPGTTILAHWRAPCGHLATARTEIQGLRRPPGRASVSLGPATVRLSIQRRHRHLPPLPLRVGQLDHIAPCTAFLLHVLSLKALSRLLLAARSMTSLTGMGTDRWGSKEASWTPAPPGQGGRAGGGGWSGTPSGGVGRMGSRSCVDPIGRRRSRQVALLPSRRDRRSRQVTQVGRAM